MMANCNCIYEEFCSMLNGEDFVLPTPCEYRKDRSRFVEAPCKIGSTIYMIVTKRPKINFPEFSFIKTSNMTENNFFRVCRDYGKTVFLTREEAEAALAKMGD